MKKIEQIQYITQDSSKYSHAEQAELMYKNGIKWVQIRMKNAADSEILRQSIEALEHAKKYNATLIINDSVEITKEIGAHGVHLGLNDLSIDNAREFIGEDFIIGGTANTLDDIIAQASKGADYIGLGPFKNTTTKKKLSPIIGLDGYYKIIDAAIKNNISIPIVGVGGICMNDIDNLKNTGLYGVAISTALLEKYANK